ncbi:triose-phosphate transporter family-domain-containing protein [Chytriomyces cf. hyalinus JEL632]|nr:triose-phosphate transporter family-domain-containing protein [Chytriomyces cf. hyalinus JEL632]
MKPRSIAFIALWYVSSSLLSMSNKQMLGKEHSKFNYPLLLSGVHSISNSIVTSIMLRLFYKDGQKRKTESTMAYLRETGPTALCGVLDIGLSNASLHYISLSFYTIVKSVVPVWVLCFSVVFGLEKMKMNLFLVIALMCAGVAFTVMGEIHFSWFGFTLIQMASLTSGLRWSLTQLMLQHKTQKSKTVTLHKPFSGSEREPLSGTSTELDVEKTPDNPVRTLNRLSPIMAGLFTVATLLWESGGEDGWRQSAFFADFSSTVQTLLLLNVGSLMALIMTLSQFHVVSTTGVLTLSVAGVVKVLFTVAFSMFWFGDTMTLMGLFGLTMSSAGIALYSYLKIQSSKSAIKKE